MKIELLGYTISKTRVPGAEYRVMYGSRVILFAATLDEALDRIDLIANARAERQVA